ncbi:hypothetical protein [Clostridium butyricum]|uniref:hypothetical protein n=1 Tax=Clostridium butyricum TaxID=1492 RepID=UPI0004250F01|nr:hypothetical protein [Clostridium butyricum]
MKPILFNTEMVQAILDSRKTTTRRIIKVNNSLEFMGFKEGKALLGKGCCIHETIKAPYMLGDILYVRETWKQYEKRVGRGNQCHLEKFYGYKTDESNPKNPSEFYDGNWKPSIHMPKVAARIFLRVKDVKVEKLQDITEDGSIREGAEDNGGTRTPKNFFVDIWNRTVNKKDMDKYSWNANPYVWVIEFERCDKPNER